MIAHLRGRVAARGANGAGPGSAWVVVDVAGVGYRVHVAGGDRIPPRGEPVELHTSLQVREDSMTLYGFAEAGALDLFEVLLGSSGVGPKLALAALSTHRPDVLRTAIATSDVATLTAVPGIGKKVAQRLVLELRERVGGITGSELDPGGTTAAPDDPLAEAREGLLALGYSAGEVQESLTGLDATGADSSELLRRALRVLAGSAPVGTGR